MPKKNVIEMPENYPVCILGDCTQAATCLHRIAYSAQVDKRETMTLINPVRCTQNRECNYYRCNTPITYARGFTGFQKRMYPDQYRKFNRRLQSYFGRNPYFERRNGTVLMPPAEQQVVMNALKQVGVTQEMKFDDYEDHVNWCDKG